MSEHGAFGHTVQLWGDIGVNLGDDLDKCGGTALHGAELIVVAIPTIYLRETAANIPVTPGSVWREIAALGAFLWPFGSRTARI